MATLGIPVTSIAGLLLIIVGFVVTEEKRVGLGIGTAVLGLALALVGGHRRLKRSNG